MEGGRGEKEGRKKGPKYRKYSYSYSDGGGASTEEIVPSEGRKEGGGGGKRAHCCIRYCWFFVVASVWAPPSLISRISGAVYFSPFFAGASVAETQLGPPPEFETKKDLKRREFSLWFPKRREGERRGGDCFRFFRLQLSFTSLLSVASRTAIQLFYSTHPRPSLIKRDEKYGALSFS